MSKGLNREERWKRREAMKRLSEAAVATRDPLERLRVSFEKLGKSIESLQMVLGEHTVRMRRGEVECVRCGAVSSDPDLVEELRCVR